MFLEAQDFIIKKNTLHQDNQCAIRVEQNGKLSSKQKIKHFDTRSFWIKDKLRAEDIKVICY